MTSGGMAPEVQVHWGGEGSPGAERVAEVALRVLEWEGVRRGELSITLLEDSAIRELNRRFLGKDRATDVLAFALHEEGESVLGDVYVGAGQARRQAAEWSVPLEEELLRLVIHGILHVLGYTHPEGEERLTSPMFRRQEELLARVLEPPPSASGDLSRTTASP